ncbi:MAG: hypothetical protein K5906_01635 [Bacilli bacterium]|nr:hypothetical protein [Bacilli bacterium]
MLNALISLSDKDKRVILIFFLLLVVVIAFVAVIGAIIIRVMRWQGKKMDDLVHDVVVTHVIDNRKDFISYARIKNWRLFFTQAWIPLIIIAVAVFTLIIRNSATNDWSYNLLDYKKTGFNTLFFVWDFNDPTIYHTFFGIRMICDWPPIINYPHFSIDAWCSYIFFFGLLVGGTWYLIVLQSLIARTIRMYKLSYDIYRKSLDGYNSFADNNNQLK